MITNRTCLILGAGASMPYGLPSGLDLRDLIVLDTSARAIPTALQYPVWDPMEQKYFDMRCVRHSAPVFQQQESAVQHWKNYLDRIGMPAGVNVKDVDLFRDAVFEARSPSIDRFLQFNDSSWGKLGRWYIAAVILSCERVSHLDKDWYQELLNQIAPDPLSLKKGDLSVITFNYDRSFERFFLSAFEGQFALSRGEATELLSKIEIEHVYGSLGPLEEVSYGDTSKAKEAAEQINLMRGGQEHPKQKRINEIIAEAKNVIFAGFSFADENLELFSPLVFEKKHLVAATSYGLSQNRINAASNRFKALRSPKRFLDGTALDLLNSQDVFRGKELQVKPEEPPRVRIARDFESRTFVRGKGRYL